MWRPPGEDQAGAGFSREGGRMGGSKSLKSAIFCSALALVFVARGAWAETPAPAQPQPQPGAETRPAEAPAPPPAPMEIPAIIIDGRAAVSLLGKPVQSAKNEDFGRVVDVVTDRNGVLRAAIIDFGGFLGVGTRKIAVDWRALHFPEKGGMDKLIADLSRDELKSAPAYKEGEPIVVIGAPTPPPPPPETKSEYKLEAKPPEQKP